MFFLRGIYTFSGYFFLYVLVTCIVMILSSQFVQKLAKTWNNTNKQYILNEKRSRRLLYVILILAFTFPIVTLKLSGFQLADLTSLDRIMALSNKMSIMRYSGQEINSSLNQVFLIFVYLAPLYGGFLYAQVGKKLKKYCLATILPSFLLLIVTNAKLGLIFGVISWCASYFVGCVFLQKPVFEKISTKARLKLIAIAAIFVGILFTSMVFRTGKTDSNTVDAIKVKFGVYLFGGLPAADIWYNNYLEEDNHDYYYGGRTFAGISNFLGILERKQGVFTDGVTFGEYNNQQLHSNIFTGFRYVIEDYGLIGSVVFFFIMGFMANYSYYRVKMKRNIYINITIVIISLTIYLCIWLQPVITMYTSTLLATILLYFVLKLSYSQNPSS
jgi:oligosaccharide repeat unit polymerase